MKYAKSGVKENSINRGAVKNYIGSKQIETENLILKVQNMQEQKRLLEILMDWNKQKEYYNGKRPIVLFLLHL